MTEEELQEIRAVAENVDYDSFSYPAMTIKLVDEIMRLRSVLKQYADESNWDTAIQFSEFGRAEVKAFKPDKSKSYEMAHRALYEIKKAPGE